MFSNLYRNYLLNSTIKFLKNYQNSTKFLTSKKKNLFSTLCIKYGTDKSYFIDFENKNRGHFYSSYYNQIFGEKRQKIRLVLECGIGSIDEKIPSNMSKYGKKYGKAGASLKVFRDYFQNAQIYGADIDKKTLINKKRIKCYYVDQLNSNSINKMWKKINKDNFDIIVDDAMHDLNASLNFFNLSFSKLKRGGFYIIEDVNISYLTTLANKLKIFKPEIIYSKNKNNVDDYLFLIKKN